MISESADDGLRCEQFRQIAEIGGDVAWILAYPGRELSYVSTTAVTLLGHERAALVRELQGGGALAPLLAGLDERVRRFIGGDDSRRQLTRHLDWTRADGEKIALEVVSALVVERNLAPAPKVRIPVPKAPLVTPAPLPTELVPTTAAPVPENKPIVEPPV